MKRFLGIICLLYAFIFTYVVIFDKLKNFLAPSMQIYLKLSIIPLLVIGIVMLTNKSHYKFKFSDLVLIVPLIFLILAGDGRLTSSFASNRSSNFNGENRITKEEKRSEENNNKEEKRSEENNNKEENNNDLSKIDFDVNDKNYVFLADSISSATNVEKIVGKTIKVRGLVLKVNNYMGKGYFAIGKYQITCCAADAGVTGFVVKYNTSKIETDKWYEIEGVFVEGKDNTGVTAVYIEIKNIKEIDSQKEELYVYPCYYYGDEYCQQLLEYDIE